LEGREALEGREGGDLQRLVAELSHTSPLFGPAPLGDGYPDESAVRERVEAAIRGLADGTGAVVVGHGAAALLHDRPDTLRVRLDGPAEARARQAMAAESLDEAAARRRLQATDRARETYVRRLCGRDPRDPGLYQLVLDATALPLPTCAELIVEAARSLQRSGVGHRARGEL
jgi:cytidylate kinase